MRALVCDAGLQYVPDYVDPEPPSGEALVHVRLAGICNTDVELVRGYMSFSGVLGHEFVGEVVRAAEPAWVGQRVVGDINAACYACPTCLAGRHTHCPHRTTLGIFRRDGAFADFLCLPVRNLHVVPGAVTDEQAVFAEPLAAACEILEQLAIRPTDRVVVLGDGKLGLLVSAVLRLTGARLLLVGRHDHKLAIARAWGVATVQDGEKLTQGQADVVVECTGSPSGFTLARRLLRPRGTLVLKSTYHDDPLSAARSGHGAGSGRSLAVDMSALVVDEITVVGSRCGPFEPALRLLAAGHIDPTPLISAEYPLVDGVAAFGKAVEPGVLKVLLRM